MISAGKTGKIFITAALLILPGCLFGKLKINQSGYFKNYFTVWDQPVIDSSLITGSVYHSIRYKLLVSINHSMQINFAYSLSGVVERKDQHLSASQESSEYRFDDLTIRLFPCDDNRIENFAVYQNLDRAYMKIRINLGDIYIGRQPFSWGMSRNYCPTDFISPFSLNQLDQEQRRGSDGVRIKIPFGMMNELDFGWISGSNAKSELNGYFSRVRVNIFKTDFEFITAYFRENLLIGGALTRSIFQAGFWGEGAYIVPDFAGNPDHLPRSDFFKFSTGLDYSWWGTLYGFIEYDYNGGGKLNPDEYYLSQLQPAYSQLGKHYLGGGLNYQFRPLISISGNIIINLNDKSLFITPRIEYNVAENIYLYFGSYSGFGEKPTVNGIQSEFGSYPSIYYSSFSIYF